MRESIIVRYAHLVARGDMHPVIAAETVARELVPDPPPPADPFADDPLRVWEESR